jgi:hypothetical protein
MRKRKYLYCEAPVLCERQISALNLPVGATVLVEITNPEGDFDYSQKGRFIPIPTQTYGFLTILETGYSFTDSDGCVDPEGYEWLRVDSAIGRTIRIALPDAPTDWMEWVAPPIWKDANGNSYKEVNGVLEVV